jgi:hypothetical protein
MSLKTVAPYATKDLSVPIGQKIAISTNGGDNVTIWYQTDAGVSPVGWYVHDVIVNEAVLLGTFSGVQGVRIETQSSPALYNIGVSPTIGVGDASTLNGYTQDATATADTIALRDSNGDIQANAFESTVATGTAPLTVASITKVANLNADLLDDLNTATASTASTVAARDASGSLTANVLISDVAIGTAPLTVTSTTVVPNLNVDQTDGYDVAETATVSTIAARDASGDITANAFESTVATGTAPLTVTSITKVANLNADLLDDLNSATASTASTIAARDASGDLTANVLISDVAGGTAPLNVTSTTKVANLNADLLDDLNTATASTASTIAARDASGNLTANVLVSDVAIGTAPLTVTSTTVVPNLNADTVDSLHASDLVNVASTQNITGTKTFTNNITIDRDLNSIFILDCGSTSQVDIIQFMVAGSLKGDIYYTHNATPANETLAFHVGGSTNTVLTLAGDDSATFAGTVTISGDTSVGDLYLAQGAQTAKTTSTTLTAAEINTGIITVNNGAAGTTTLTLPLATAMDSQFTGVAAGYSWDFSVVNISTTAAEDADVGTNTGWTLVGNMDIEADDDPRARSSAKFRARKTGAGAWTLYRVA